MRFVSLFLLCLSTVCALPSGSDELQARQTTPSYWYETFLTTDLPYGPNPNYNVTRNVKNFGAYGDGVHDDTAAIQNAIASGGRCNLANCQSTTTTPAVVYFPAGTYVISSPILVYYFTQLWGNPNSLPVIKASSNFQGSWLIDGDPYNSSGLLSDTSTNIFYRQIKNMVFDTTAVPINNGLIALHWPTAQATSIQNVAVNMPTTAGVQHSGILIESGSGGLIADMTFSGGVLGMGLANQQFTFRNITIKNAVTAVKIYFDWSFTFRNLVVQNCQIGINGSVISGVPQAGGITVIDSDFINVPIGFTTVANSGTSIGLIIENVVLVNVPTAVQGAQGQTYLAGTTSAIVIGAWANGHGYTQGSGNQINYLGSYTATNRSASLQQSGSSFYYARAKPNYANLTASQILRVRKNFGAAGNGVTDDTNALQNAISTSAAQGVPLFIEAGVYLVTKTIVIPAGARILGETYPNIMSSGPNFNQNYPVAVLQVGRPGDTGSVELSDFVVSTQGAQQGAVLIQWFLSSPSTSPSGIWDVHTRMGGFAGSNLQYAQCPAKNGTASVFVPACAAAYASVIMDTTSSGVYFENNWFWTADHDLEDPNSRQISIFTGRGMLIQSTSGVFWLNAVASEHHSFYQFQFQNTKNIFASMLQTETPYYQPIPSMPFTPNASINDPNIVNYCNSQGQASPCGFAWPLRLSNTQNLALYGVGLYSFFYNYNSSCSRPPVAPATGYPPFNCQIGLLSLVNSNTNLDVYNLAGIGAPRLILQTGNNLVGYNGNQGNYPGEVALFHSGN